MCQTSLNFSDAIETETPTHPLLFCPLRVALYITSTQLIIWKAHGYFSVFLLVCSLGFESEKSALPQHWGLDLRSGFLMLLEMWFGLTTLNCNLWVVVDIPLSHADQCTEMKLCVLMWKNYPMGMEYDKYRASPLVNIFLLC